MCLGVLCKCADSTDEFSVFVTIYVLGVLCKSADSTDEFSVFVTINVLGILLQVC